MEHIVTDLLSRHKAGSTSKLALAKEEQEAYDLLWYLGDPAWPAPNLTLLNNALGQTGWTGKQLTAENWRAIVRQHVAGLSWERVVTDVRPFLEHESEATTLSRENLLRVLDE